MSTTEKRDRVAVLREQGRRVANLFVFCRAVGDLSAMREARREYAGLKRAEAVLRGRAKAATAQAAA